VPGGPARAPCQTRRVGFELFVVASLAVLVLALLAIGRWHPKSGAEVLDWKPTRSYEDEIQLELEDVDQMLDAQNERRRATGRAELSEDEVRREVEAEQRAQHERAERYAREGGEAGPGEG
jgi:hypothetical protein